MNWKKISKKISPSLNEEWNQEMKFFWGSKHMSSQIWCYLKLVRWRDEEWDEEMNRWKIIFGSEHMSSQIWCSLKLARCRDEKWDEEINRWKKNFGVWTYVKPNLVLSQISEMKRWRVRWRNEQMKKKFLSERTYYLFLVAMDSYGPHVSPCTTICLYLQ